MVDCVRAASYGDGTTSNGTVALSGMVTDVTGRHVILIEDIVDTGLTLTKLAAAIMSAGARTQYTHACLPQPFLHTAPAQTARSSACTPLNALLSEFVGADRAPDGARRPSL